MKKKVTVTAKAIVNNGKGIISIIITNNLPNSTIHIIGHYADVRYDKNAKWYHVAFVDTRIPDYLKLDSLDIINIIYKLQKYLNGQGLKDCIIREESITKTYNKVVNKIVVGVDTKGHRGKLYIHCYLPDRKEYFELVIYRGMIECGVNWHLIPGEGLKLSKQLNEDEYNVVEDKLLHFLSKLDKSNKSFVKTIKC